jgi:hypothetical protein
MFNVYKNQLSRQTGSRNLTGPKTLSTIWGTYMMLVTKYQISAIKLHTLNICTFFVTFFSATIDGRDLIFGHKLHIGTPYRGKHFWTHQIPTSCLPKSGGCESYVFLLIHMSLFLNTHSQFCFNASVTYEQLY